MWCVFRRSAESGPDSLHGLCGNFFARFAADCDREIGVVDLLLFEPGMVVEFTQEGIVVFCVLCVEVVCLFPRCSAGCLAPLVLPVNVRILHVVKFS